MTPEDSFCVWARDWLSAGIDADFSKGNIVQISPYSMRLFFGKTEGSEFENLSGSEWTITAKRAGKE